VHTIGRSYSRRKNGSAGHIGPSGTSTERLALEEVLGAKLRVRVDEDMASAGPVSAALTAPCPRRIEQPLAGILHMPEHCRRRSLRSAQHPLSAALLRRRGRQSGRQYGVRRHHAPGTMFHEEGKRVRRERATE